MSYCGTCANHIPAGTKFCSKDGTPLGQGAAFCVNCSTPLKPEAKFCSSCGNQVRHVGQQTNTKPGQCSNCLSQNEAGVTVCSVCGKPLSNPLLPPAPSVMVDIQKNNIVNTGTTTIPNQPVQPKPLEKKAQVNQPKQVSSLLATSSQTKNKKPEKYSSIVDSKGRATLPKQIRAKLGIEEGASVLFYIEGENVFVRGTKRRKVGKNE